MPDLKGQWSVGANPMFSGVGVVGGMSFRHWSFPHGHLETGFCLLAFGTEKNGIKREGETQKHGMEPESAMEQCMALPRPSAALTY